MGASQPYLTSSRFRDLQNHITCAARRCSDAQLIALADNIHDLVRYRRDRRNANRFGAPGDSAALYG